MDGSLTKLKLLILNQNEIEVSDIQSGIIGVVNVKFDKFGELSIIVPCLSLQEIPSNTGKDGTWYP